MIPKECKRLAEVDLPIAVVSKHAAKEKSIRHGHPGALHLWWARRPLAAWQPIQKVQHFVLSTGAVSRREHNRD
jgi:hypothetical protein